MLELKFVQHLIGIMMYMNKSILFEVNSARNWKEVKFSFFEIFKVDFTVT